MDNQDEFYEASDSEGAVLREFVSAWASEFGQQSVGVSQLYTMISALDIPIIDLGKGNDHSQKIRLGYKLKSMRDRQIGNFKVTAGKLAGHAQQWILKPTHLKPVNVSKSLSVSESAIKHSPKRKRRKSRR